MLSDPLSIETTQYTSHWTSKITALVVQVSWANPGIINPDLNPYINPDMDPGRKKNIKRDIKTYLLIHLKLVWWTSKLVGLLSP